ncbi:MAG: protoporphyrinogen/coproporphyrinogen oxidase, partial [Terriglobales bacterium]
MTTDSPITAIVGGGIAGLSAAWSLQQAGHACVVLEAESRWGGMIDSERVQGFLVEGGPDSFLAAKPAAVELCRELGLEADLIATGPQPGGPRLLHLRQLLPLPPGWRLLAPTRLAPVLRSPLFSPAVKAALVLRWPWSNTAPHDNETVAAYLERRFGRHVGRAFAATVVQPLLAGVYGGRADELSAALMAPPPPRPGAAPGGSVFLSLRHGMASLAERLADRLAPRLRPSCPVRALTASAKGFRLHCEGGAALDAHSVILAVPAWRAAQLLQDFDAGVAIPLSEIPYTSSVNVNLAYRTAPPL